MPSDNALKPIPKLTPRIDKVKEEFPFACTQQLEVSAEESSSDWETIETRHVAIDCSYVNMRPSALAAAAKSLTLAEPFLAHVFEPSSQPSSPRHQKAQVQGSIDLHHQKWLAYNAQTVPVVGTALYIELTTPASHRENGGAAAAQDSDENLIEFLNSTSQHQTAKVIGQATSQIMLNYKLAAPSQAQLAQKKCGGASKPVIKVEAVAEPGESYNNKVNESVP